ncbi:hypothetical protein TWF281_006603 [Arthrobotrys megalospora]
MLWVSADPGTGKSVLAKYLVDTVLPTTESQTTCYFFFKDDFEGQGSITIALCCILFQLFTAKRSLLSEAMIERFEIVGEGFVSSFSELWNAFLVAAKNEDSGEIVCVLDALDECETSGMSQLIAELHKLYSTTTYFNLKFLVTSRPIRGIRHGFQRLEVPGSSFIHLCGDNEEEVEKISHEIDIFIEVRVQDIGNKLKLTDGERNLLQERLKSARNRTYLWVSLTLNLIESDINIHLTIDEKLIAKVTSSLPKTVDEAYERILAKSCDHEEAKILLHIIVAAAVPLTLQEMSVALQLARDENHQLYGSLNLKTEERICNDVRDLCGFFVIVVEARIYLIHQTAKEFLIRQEEESRNRHVYQTTKWKNSLRLEYSHHLLCGICVRYLFSTEFNIDPLLAGEDVSKYTNKYIFLDYSAKHWTTHLRKSRFDLDKLALKAILKLCDTTSPRCLTWFRIYWTSTNTDFPEDPTNLILASYFGFTAAVKRLLRLGNDIDLNSQDRRYGRSALSWAAGNGFDAVVARLLKVHRWKGVRSPFGRGAFVDSSDKYRRTPLVYAVWNRHIPVIRILLKAGARVDLEDDIGGTPLSYAICSGHDDVADHLLKKSDGAVSKDLISVDLLGSAAERGHEDVIKLLLEIGKVNPDSTNKVHSTPMLRAARNGHEGAIRLLMQSGADVEAKSEDNWTPLLYAAASGREKIVQMLLESGANVNATVSTGWTSLLMAADKGYERVVQVLLEGSANTEAKDRDCWTPLLFACARGHEKVVRTLLEGGANINATDYRGWTALLIAAANGHEKTVEVLLENGAYIETEDPAGWTPLLHAAEKGQEGVVRLLIKEGANLEAKTNYGLTAVGLAAAGGNEPLVQTLLDCGADMDGKGGWGFTPSFRDRVKKYEAAVQMLEE